MINDWRVLRRYQNDNGMRMCAEYLRVNDCSKTVYYGWPSTPL